MWLKLKLAWRRVAVRGRATGEEIFGGKENVRGQAPGRNSYRGGFEGSGSTKPNQTLNTISFGRNSYYLLFTHSPFTITPLHRSLNNPLIMDDHHPLSFKVTIFGFYLDVVHACGDIFCV